MSETTAGENIKFLDSDVPDISADAAARVVRELYGIEGAFSRLYSERDQNFRVRATDGSDYVLAKASHENPAALASSVVESMRSDGAERILAKLPS